MMTATTTATARITGTTTHPTALGGLGAGGGADSAGNPVDGWGLPASDTGRGYEPAPVDSSGATAGRTTHRCAFLPAVGRRGVGRTWAGRETRRPAGRLVRSSVERSRSLRRSSRRR